MMDDGWWMICDGWWMIDDGWWILDDGLSQHRIKITSSDFKRTQRPCLVQKEARFDEDGCLSLQEWASACMIRRLCLATWRPCLLKQTWWIVFKENTKTFFLMFQTDICVPIQLFLSLTVFKNHFYLDFSDPWGLLLDRTNICLKTFYKTCTCLILHLFYKTDPLFYQTRHLSLPNRAEQISYLGLVICLQVCMRCRPNPGGNVGV